ncbi:hypothetical protein AB6G96_02570 [Staphylococcus haemolyticus]|uniref:hypothetical protein n=1 Tax=Staphylococcus haemolyticus TaxID=1283 RepID=UPI000AD939C5|nr:hypothetical protein [Staphylococcus haemolyticus]MCH4383842.1 hypothetical protein [Staphylococcus haemolyticus]MCH4486143.1 hypothetical protein [Staphylococcus haemolyticus]MDT4246576.1 hypothetical protein [Staphylococcus haemolyticus]MDT4256572.1 hypothetical protein [Staphylococcus haemolyticus]MDT4258787.1 hypothetical protein [Staphylococcus haemolyticus]
MKTFTIVSFGSDLQKLGRELQYIQVENQIVKIITNNKTFIYKIKKYLTLFGVSNIDVCHRLNTY